MEKNNTRIITKQLIIAGGGLAGICAAVAAARHGIKVALVHERPVLGGNSSSEVRVWACGATAMGNNRYADETGIISELLLENLYRNKEGNPYLWDLLLLDFVKKEEKIDLFLNTCVDKVIMEGRLIKAVSGIQLGSELRLEFQAPLFIDCTGDGTVGFLAGAEYMQGREGKEDFGESMAQPKADRCTLGSSVFFTVKDMGKEVKFTPPDFVYSMQQIKQILSVNNKQFKLDQDGCNLWWIEYGGVMDTIGSNELIKEELQKIVYGIWNYIKNSGEYESKNLTLEWVGSVPGKRESRRLKGNYILTQNDLIDHSQFEDTVGYGGWPIDVHPEEGIFSENLSCQQTPVGLYAIPFRCLYSKNIDNLLFAGRNISVSHIALASTRVMKTCAILGQAVGTAAALAVKHGKGTKDFSNAEIKTLQQTLLKDDCWIIGLKNTDPNDHARMATIKASGFKRFEAITSCGQFQLTVDLFLVFPPLMALEKLSLLMDSLNDTVLYFEVYESKGLEDHIPFRKLTETSYKLSVGQERWTDINLGLNSTMKNIIVKINSNPDVFLHTADDKCYGMFAVKGNPVGLNLVYPCFQITPVMDYYSPDNVINGYNRPLGKPNLWVSNNLQEAESWLELIFDHSVKVNEVILYLNHDLNRDYNNLQPDYYRNGWDRMYEGLIKDFKVLLIGSDGECKAVSEIKENRQRHVILRFNEIEAKIIRLEIDATYGSKHAEIYEIRVY